jgi:major vault protein
MACFYKVSLSSFSSNYYYSFFFFQTRLGPFPTRCYGALVILQVNIIFRDADTHIPDVYEQVVGVVNATTLTSRQFCVIVDPVVADGKNRLGHRELRKGECTFFLRPGEKLEKGIQNIYVLGEEEALLLKAKVAFDETVDKEKKLRRRAGDRWMIYGPCDYIPSIEIEVVERRTAIPLDSNEGIYVRDIAVGTVRAVVGQSYMLKPTEELWAKELPKTVDELLMKSTSRDQNEGSSHDSERDPTRVISYRVPHNAAVQIYDFKQKKARVVFGPELVMLGPEEQFTVLNLSGGVPKRPNYIKSLALFLGPDFMTDLITVETADHARLSLKLSYNWHFDVPDHTNQAEASKIFSTPDFTGDLCKAIGSLVRGAVAASSFDEFHKHSADIIHSAVFGKSNDRLLFPGNNLYVTNIDVQSVEPVDQRTLDSLQKSVQLAIEITTKSQEAAARQEAERLEQEARGRLERQRISDEAEAEKARKRLLELQAASAAVESTGQASAEAKAHAEAALIEGQAEVTQAKLTSEALTIQAAAELEQLKLRQESEITHAKALAELEISKARELAEIEAEKFKSLVDAIGADTITAIARAGPEMQAKLLSGLGLKVTFGLVVVGGFGKLFYIIFTISKIATNKNCTRFGKFTLFILLMSLINYVYAELHDHRRQVTHQPLRNSRRTDWRCWSPRCARRCRLRHCFQRVSYKNSKIPLPLFSPACDEFDPDG